MAKYTDLGKGLDAFVAQLLKAASPKVAEQVAEQAAREAASTIQRRTRQGFGVARDGGALERLAPLSPAYVKYRRANASRLSSFTSPGRSNLTFSSELLGSLSVAKRGGAWKVVLEGAREDGLTNAQLARYVSRRRPFLNLAKSEIETIAKSARRTFASLVKR